MFGTKTTEQPAATPVAAPVATPVAAFATTQALAPVTLESLLGLNLSTVKAIEGGTWPKGIFGFQITDVLATEYDIKADDHPRVGQKAAMVTLSFTCVKTIAGTMTNVEGAKLTEEEAASWEGKVYKENVMFGNDGLPDKKTGAISQTGQQKLVTLLIKILGAENYGQLVAATGGNLGQMLEQFKNSGYRFGCELNYNTPKDPSRRPSSQINLFGQFGAL